MAQPQRSLARPGRRHRSPLHRWRPRRCHCRRRGPISNRLKRGGATGIPVYRADELDDAMKELFAVDGPALLHVHADAELV